MTNPMSWPRRRLADRYWLLAHDGEPLRAVVGHTALSLGVGAALLGELLLDEAVSVRPAVQPRPVTAASGDYLCARVRSEISEEPGHDVRTWVSYLAVQSAGQVRARLLLDGLLEESSVTSGRVRPVTYPVWSPTTDERPRLRQELQTELRTPGYVLGGTGTITVPESLTLATLAGIAQATNVLPHVARPRRADQVENWCQRLPARLADVINTVSVLLAESATR